MLRSSLYLALVFLAQSIGPGHTQVWEHLTPAQFDGPVGSNIARVASDGFGAGVTLDAVADRWTMSGFLRPVGDARYIQFIVERNGETIARTVNRGEFSVNPSQSSDRVVVSFWLREPELELLMSGDTLYLEVGVHGYSFPLSGSRRAISRLVAVLQPHREALADDREHTIVQARSDCDQQAAHPDDELSNLPGVKWSDLVPEVAVDVCRFAFENSEGLERKRMLYQLGRSLDKAGDPEALEVLFKAGENFGYPIALNHLGILYRDGEYTEVNRFLAERFFRWAAEKGNLPAQYNLARLMLEDAHSPKEVSEAYGMLNVVSMAGYPMAQEFYGKAILDGKIDGATDAMALSVLSEASEAGKAGASMALAEMFRDGKGVSVSPSEYLKYLRRAANQGDEEAKQELGLE